MSLSSLLFIGLPAMAFWVFVISRVFIAVCNVRQLNFWLVQLSHWSSRMADTIRSAYLAHEQHKEENAERLEDARKMLLPERQAWPKEAVEG